MKLMTILATAICLLGNNAYAADSTVEVRDARLVESKGRFIKVTYKDQKSRQTDNRVAFEICDDPTPNYKGGCSPLGKPEGYTEQELKLRLNQLEANAQKRFFIKAGLVILGTVISLAIIHKKAKSLQKPELADIRNLKLTPFHYAGATFITLPLTLSTAAGTSVALLFVDNMIPDKSKLEETLKSTLETKQIATNTWYITKPIRDLAVELSIALAGIE